MTLDVRLFNISAERLLRAGDLPEEAFRDPIAVAKWGVLGGGS